MLEQDILEWIALNLSNFTYKQHLYAQILLSYLYKL